MTQALAVAASAALAADYTSLQQAIAVEFYELSCRHVCQCMCMYRDKNWFVFSAICLCVEHLQQCRVA